MLPSEYVKRNCYISCEADEKWLPLALAEVGENHVVMATDYPHFDSTFPNTVKGLRERPIFRPSKKTHFRRECIEPDRCVTNTGVAE